MILFWGGTHHEKHDLSKLSPGGQGEQGAGLTITTSVDVGFNRHPEPWPCEAFAKMNEHAAAGGMH